MKCNECGKRVSDDPFKRLEHVAKYHPVRILNGFQKIAPLARALGESIGRSIKRK